VAPGRLAGDTGVAAERVQVEDAARGGCEVLEEPSAGSDVADERLRLDLLAEVSIHVPSGVGLALLGVVGPPDARQEAVGERARSRSALRVGL
jgi:hypothetical protein